MRSTLPLFALLVPLALSAQTPTGSAGALRELRIRITDAEWARVAESGMLTFPRQGLMARASVVGIDTAGKPMSVGKLSPRWSSSDTSVVSTYGSPSYSRVGETMGLVAQEDGRATITVTAGGKTTTLPVVVGKARLTIAASELTPKFRAARLEVFADTGSVGQEAEASASGIRLRENGHGVLLRPRATAADGTVIPLEHFPVTWTTSDEKVVELYQTTDTTTQTTAHDPGTATITATFQGLTVGVPAAVVATGTTVGPMRGPQLVGGAGSGGVASISPATIGVRSGTAVPVATGTITSTVAPTTTTSATRTGAVLATTAAPATTAATSTTIAPTSRTGVPVAPTGTRESVIGAAPTGITTSPTGATGVTVRWTPAPGAASHVVAWSRSESATFVDVATVAGTASSAVVKGVPPGTSYVTVTATYGDRASGAANPVAVTMPQAPQPANFRATSAAGYVQLQWDSIPEAAGYTLSRLENGVPTPLDDHYPARTPPRLLKRTFVDARGPGSTVGYVLSAVYRAIDGAEYAGDPAAQPRTPATPLAFEAGTNAGITVTDISNQSNTLWAGYRTADAPGWVSAVRLEVLESTGWKQVNGETFSWKATDARYRAVPGARTGRMWVDPNVPGGCDHRKLFRLRVIRSIGGDTVPPQQIAEEISRPFSVTYDNASWGCHKNP